MKGWLRSSGYEITRLPGEEHWKFFPRPEHRDDWLRALGIGTVLDVGAHRGESALQFRAIFPEATIHSFEPIAECFRELETKVAGKPGHHCHNVALGERDGESVIHRSEYSPSSSLLAMGEAHKQAYPFSAKETTETIRVRTMDSLAHSLDLPGEVLLKIDTQGYEKHVLSGATAFLPQVRVLIVEVSFTELYAGQPRFPEIYSILEAAGFEYRGSWDQFLRPRDGLPLQQDAIFVRI